MQSCKTTASLKTMDLEGKWVLKTFNGQDVKSVFAGKTPTIIFNLSEGRINGTGGCNNYSGAFTLKGNEFSAPNLASTMMMCIQANQESQFLQALGEVSKLSMKNGELIFTQGEKQVLVLTKAKPLTVADLAGTWTLMSIQGSSANTLFGDETAPSIEFNASDKRVSGNAGCNRYNAPFKLTGDILEVSTPVSTRMACPHMEGENKFLKLIATKAKLELEDNMLTLRQDGRELLRFTK